MPRRVLSQLGFLLALQLAAVVLAYWAADALAFNTDTTAPISQLRLLRDGAVNGLASLRLARIPSFVPDLLLLRGLLSFEGAGQAVALIQARFALVMALLLLALETRLVMLASGLGRWLSLAVVLLLSGLLILLSPLYREALGLALSPVHHGGNLLLTLASVAVLAGLDPEPPRRRALPAWLLILALVVLGTASNLLFAATAVIPLALTLAVRPRLAARLPGGLVGALLSLAAAALAGRASLRGLNLQCAVDAGVVFQPERLWPIVRDQPLLWLALLLAIGLLVQVARRRAGVAAAMVALAALSPFAYTPFFNEIPVRYLLVSVLPLVILLPALLVPWIRGRVALPLPRAARPGPLRLTVPVALLLLLLTLAGPPARGLQATLLERASGDQKRLIERLVAGGHRHGLAGFWGTQLGPLSGGRLELQPIDDEGQPDLWALNGEAFLLPSVHRASDWRRLQPSQLKPYSFVIVDGREDASPTREEALKAYGPAAATLGCRPGGEDDFCVLLYDDPEPLRRMLAAKLQRFSNLCAGRDNLH